jgi:hypothetical protein
MMVRFVKYRDGESGMFTPGEEIYIHSAVEERKHSAIEGKMVRIFICTRAADAEAAETDASFDLMQAELVSSADMRLKTDPEPCDPKIALTTERSVAEYWACIATKNDQQNYPEAESNGVVLVLNGERLLELGHHLSLSYEKDSRQNEIACWDDVFPLDDVLVDVEDVTPQRHKEIREQGRGAVLPAPPLVGSN